MNFKFKDIFKLDYSYSQMQLMANSFNIGVILINLVSPLFIITILQDTIVHNHYLFIWLTLQISTVLIRVYSGKKLNYYIVNFTLSKIKLYFKLYLFVIILSGSLWGFILTFAIFNSSETVVFFMITLLFALSSGSILTLGTVFIAIFFYNLTMIFPTMIAFFYISTDALYVIEGVLLCTFMFVTLKTSYNKQQIMYENEKNLSLIKQYENITNQSAIISKTDINGIITHTNENFCKISGYTNKELIGQSHNIIRHPDMPAVAFKDMWETVKDKKKTWQGIVKNKAKNGDSYYVSTTVSPILDTQNNIKEFIALRHDISSIMSDKNQLFDYLETNKLSVLIMIQIEDYNTLEKFYDKASVEKIEKAFGDALLHLLPNKCNFQRVYHLGQGLYAFAKDRRTCQHTSAEIRKMLQEFLNNVKNYVVKLGKIEYDISAICSYTYGVIQTYEDAKIGIEKAIENKQDIIYADGLSGIEYSIALQNIETLHTLKVALDDKKVISYFQPIINNKTKKVDKYESLVRLITHDGKVVSPDKFLEVAKKGRYYDQVTRIVLQNSFIRLKDTTKEISINISTLDIESKDMQIVIFKLLDEYKEDSERIVFELLESEDVRDFNIVKKFIKKVKEYGVKIAIDDFGTGYSNFERLLQYEPDLLKIDGSLIKNIKDNKLSKNIVETIVLFAQKQKIKTVAEFVETEEIYNIINEMGIDYSQGYAFGKPEKLLQD
ncbi:bifunctional diguanylate cyclase/phosphodiesterase [Sulfurospirillum arcachonense]|uniref:bifunctional diguanylate cyclase/phosphodiesterase n=1 Tax=Sulfurospirillum arcachonense TaxID=57666 RepID=UPI00046AE742|nr:EAL domain-containing protein [Sulfurospirillum arcachonense]